MKKAFVVLGLALLMSGQAMDVGAVAPPTVQKTLGEALTANWIGGYIYRWNNWEGRYDAPIPISALNDHQILPYGTFWVQLNRTFNNPDGINVVFQNPDPSPNFAPWYPGVPYPSDLVAGTNRFYTISFPVGNIGTYATNPAIQDVVEIMSAWSNGNLTTAAHASGEWGIAKYIYNYDGDDPSDPNYKQSKFFYPGEASFDAVFGGAGSPFSPGQAYFFYHTYASPFMLQNPAGLVEPEGDANNEVKLKLPWADPDIIGYTLHHIGNPFWTTINLATDVMVETPVDDNLPLGKIASPVSVLDAEFWYVDLSLTSLDGTEKDQFNRIGVSTNYTGDDAPLKALDLVGPSDYFRLTVSDPNSESTTKYSYDYRSLGATEYTWQIELQTVYNNVDALLNVGNLASVPAGYSLTLTDVESGTEYELTGDTNFQINLTNTGSHTFLLKAAATPTTVEDDSSPASFAIDAVYPNPFNPVTTIAYTVNEMSDMTINVYNISGQLVDQLASGTVEAGRHSIVWDATGQSSGIYIVMLRSGVKSDMEKITLMK